MRGDAKRFLERVAKLQAGLLICVYCLSYAPALLTIEFPGPDPLEASETAEVLEHGIEEKVVDALGLESSEEGETHPAKYPRPTLTGRRLRLLFYFILMVQLSDVFQYLWSQIPLKHPIAPKINLSRTWEGIFGGAATTMLCGMALWFVTPFPHWWQAGMIALAISLMGFAGSMTMSAIKRDRGVEDYGTLIEGHSGVLDRMDSVCFAAPVFYHMTWLFLNL
jgi:phosphatidate cytidylyltransferase